MELDNNQQNSTDLTDKQRKAIPVILLAKNLTEGTEQAKIDRSTFYLWLQCPAFKEEFERQRKEVIDFALSELKISTGEAVRVLKELLEANSETVRLRAATTILENVAKFMELEEIERRILTLELSVNNGKH